MAEDSLRSPELAEMADTIAKNLIMGVPGYDHQAVTERMARASRLVTKETMTADLAYAQAAASYSLDEPTTRQTLGALVVRDAHGDLYRTLNDPRYRERLVTGVHHEIEEWGTTLLNDEDGIRYEYVPPTAEGRQDAERVVSEVERILQDTGAVPVLDDGQRAAAAELSDRVRAVADAVASLRNVEVGEPFYDPAASTATVSVTLVPPSFVDPVVTVTVTAAQDLEGVTLAIDGRAATDPMPVAEAAGILGRSTPEAQADVTVYTTPGCVACRATVRQLDKAGVAYELIDLSDRPDLVQQLRAEGLAQAPVIESPDGRRTSGFDPDRIKAIVGAALSPTTGRPESRATQRRPAAPTGSRRQGPRL